MLSDPESFSGTIFAKAGSDSLLVHWEGNNNLHRTVQHVKALGKRGGVASTRQRQPRCSRKSYRTWIRC